MARICTMEWYGRVWICSVTVGWQPTWEFFGSCKEMSRLDSTRPFRLVEKAGGDCLFWDSKLGVPLAGSAFFAGPVILKVELKFYSTAPYVVTAWSACHCWSYGYWKLVQWQALSNFQHIQWLVLVPSRMNISGPKWNDVTWTIVEKLSSIQAIGKPPAF